jgi:hypothetical protein
MRRRILMLGLLLTASCTGVNGPRAHRQDPTQVDDPRLSIAEQEQRGRDRLALPDSSSALPRGLNDSGLLPGPDGRQ